MTPLPSAFRGALLGLALGDGLGARFEGQSPEAIRRRFPAPAAFLERLPSETLVTTDDTQMMLGVAEALLASDAPDVDAYAARYAANYEPWRGYGRGARAVLEALQRGVPATEAATRYFPEGSFGNGAAMRVAPVGLRFAHDLPALRAQARASALPTHRHPLGVEGALLLARGVALALTSRGRPFDREAFFDALTAEAESDELRARLARARFASEDDDLLALGAEITAQGSVPTALALFATHPDDPARAIGHAVLLGGDCDTVAAMTGALAGARQGEAALPERWLDALEEGLVERITQLADALARRT